MKDDHAIGEAFSLQKRASNTSKHELFYFWGSFTFDLDPNQHSHCVPDPADKNQCISMRIRHWQFSIALTCKLYMPTKKGLIGGNFDSGNSSCR